MAHHDRHRGRPVMGDSLLRTIVEAVRRTIGLLSSINDLLLCDESGES